MDLALLADDGQDPGAPARRDTAGGGHVANNRPSAAAAGRLVMSGPRPRADGGTAGSLRVLRLADRPLPGAAGGRA